MATDGCWHFSEGILMDPTFWVVNGAWQAVPSTTKRHVAYCVESSLAFDYLTFTPEDSARIKQSYPGRDYYNRAYETALDVLKESAATYREQAVGGRWTPTKEELEEAYGKFREGIIKEFDLESEDVPL